MNSKNIYITRLLFCIAISISFYTCDNDISNYNRSDDVTNLVTLSLRIAGTSMQSNRALASTDENEIKSIEILLFDSEGYTQEPIYCNTVADNEFDNRIKTFSVKIPVGVYDIVILANSRSVLTNIVDNIQQGDSKESIFEKLIVTNNEKWDTDASSSTYIPIPLWGEKKGVTIASGISITDPINLVRMVSKIDISLTTDQAKRDFKLKSIRLYNYNNKGRIIPIASNWNGEDVTAPSIPNEAKKPESPNQNPLIYDGGAITSENISCLNEIYTFESAAGSSSTLQENTCLVIGGIYQSDSYLSYYRIDFAQTASGNIIYLPLLRNHHYAVNITEISGSGQTTPEEAFKALPVNIKAEILNWDVVDVPSMITDGQSWFAVSQGKFTLSKESRTVANEDNILSITTDYPMGWTVDKIVGTNNTNISWLRTNKTNGVSGELTEVSLLLDQNISGYNRSAFIHFNAGRLTYIVEVIQNIQSAINLLIKDAAGQSEIEELIFGIPESVPPLAKQFIVQWEPTNSPVSITREAVGDKSHFDFAPYSEKPGLDMTIINNPLGSKTLNIIPTKITLEELIEDPFKEKLTKVNFSVNKGAFWTTKSLFLRHYIYNLIVDHASAYIYNPLGKHNIYVKSNCDWVVSNINDPNGLLDIRTTDNLRIGTTGSYNITTGKKLTFNIKQNNTQNGFVFITFSSFDRKFEDRTISFEVNPLF